MKSNKALLIGIDYKETNIKSDFNIYDVKRFDSVILKNFNTTIMTDDLEKDSEYYPNYENIISILKTFFKDEDTNYIFMYCGASRDRYDKIKDEDGVKLDQRVKINPAILPRGLNTSVIDCIDLRNILIDSLHSSSTLTCIFSSNYGHELLNTKYIFDIRRGKFNINDENLPNTPKNILSICLSSREMNPVEMTLKHGTDNTMIKGSLGVFSLISLIQDSFEYKLKIPLNAWIQVLLKKMVESNPCKTKTMNMINIGGEDPNISSVFF